MVKKETSAHGSNKINEPQAGKKEKKKKKSTSYVKMLKKTKRKENLKSA